jgi:hypothetical protein
MHINSFLSWFEKGFMLKVPQGLQVFCLNNGLDGGDFSRFRLPFYYYQANKSDSYDPRRTAISSPKCFRWDYKTVCLKINVG